MKVLIDPVVPFKQPVHHIGVFRVDISRIDGTERLIFRDVRTDGVEQWITLLAALY